MVGAGGIVGNGSAVGRGGAVGSGSAVGMGASVGAPVPSFRPSIQPQAAITASTMMMKNARLILSTF
jgi:hypothetical protein